MTTHDTEETKTIIQIFENLLTDIENMFDDLLEQTSTANPVYPVLYLLKEQVLDYLWKQQELWINDLIEVEDA